ncbi:hypothetical protein Rs2_18191 [Raphanus sativus]|uniref:Uncharacterized protein LOC108851069 n=1 Tax=Raphanus sativus TaxID=3726 RepID=A0A6J0N680_RAPSA|nr:uncharacterized protein LOC108851069 [Raphanus sativus]KAJ4904240.1 hypothetical protein Rs2_18191 [Raphanus sativus]
MRCKRHTVDSSSSIGVCASCLRERLLSLAASAAASEDNNHPHPHSRTSPPPPPPPPLVLPRAVSPYAAARNSDARGGGGEGSSSSSEKVFETNRSFKKKQTGLSRFSTFFRTSSNEFSSQDSCDATSRSWFSKVLSPRSKKQTANTTTTCYIEDLIASESNHQQHQPRQRYCRGMSPANEPVSVEDSPGRARRTTPASTGTPGRRKTAATTMALCLSPLVRAKPKPNSSFGGYTTGELKSPVKPHISTAASFCANRSKKLAGLGRADHRR